MARNADAPDEEPGADAEKRLVCGICEELLEATYGSQQAAEDAADEHKRAEHGGPEEAVVVPVSSMLVEMEGEDGVVEIAVGAQERLDDGEVGEAFGL